MSEPERVSPSALASYATCPRQYEYDKIWDAEAPEASRRYLDRGLVYHNVIEDTCEMVAAEPRCSDDEIRAFARERVHDRWDTRTDRSEYASDAQYRYDLALTVGAIESFFGDVGIEHVRNSVGTEEWLRCDRDGVYLVGRADNIVRTDDGLCVIDYKGSLNGIVTWGWAEKIAAHHDGEEYAADRLKSVFQAAAYIEGAKGLDAYEPGMDVEFTFYGVMTSKEPEAHVDGIQVSVDGRGRDVGEIYRTYEDEIWSLIRECYEGILAEDYLPARFAEIYEHSCSDCDYQGMCGEYLGAEVGIHD